MNAEKYGLDRIYFGGYFIRGEIYLTCKILREAKPNCTAVITGHAATVATLSYAIRFWSKGTKKAMFLRHEGFLYVFPLFPAFMDVRLTLVANRAGVPLEPGSGT